MRTASAAALGIGANLDSKVCVVLVPKICRNQQQASVDSYSYTRIDYRYALGINFDICLDKRLDTLKKLCFNLNGMRKSTSVTLKNGS